MAHVTVNGYVAQQPKKFNDNTSVRVAEKFFNSKTKEKETRWWDVVVYDPKGRVYDVLSDTSKSRFVSASGDLSVRIYNEQPQLTCWTFRSGFAMNVTDKGAGAPGGGDSAPTGEPVKFKISKAPEDDDVPF